MNMIHMNNIQNKIRGIAEKIDVPVDLLPTYVHSNDFGHPHIELEGDLMCYVVNERGEEISRKVTFDLDELLFWVFKDITFQMADVYWQNNKKLDIDPRRILFKKQAEFLFELNSEWGEKILMFQSRILREAPFDDKRSARINFIVKLQMEGESLEEAIEKANRKYSIDNSGDNVDTVKPM